jgi:hypothetical protein
MQSERDFEKDAAAAIRIVLRGMRADLALGALARELEPLHPRNNTFPAEVLLDLAADAIEESGASRADPLATDRIRKRLLPEGAAHMRAQHYKADFAVRAAAMVCAGVDPALLEEAGGWREDDLWYWSLEACVVYVRAAAERGGVSVPEVCDRLARRRGVD